MIEIGVNTWTDNLSCPNCFSTYLHQCAVEVFYRSHEDQPSRSVLIRHDAGPVNGNPDSNPSARRDGILMSFWCEGCHDSDNLPPDLPKLAIVQHKGETFVFWKL